ncbi:MAG: hypothetical protein WB615_03535 [Candidatus Tumulicola sp.]
MQWFRAAIQWAGDHWAVLAVVIPVVGLIVAGIVNHYLALARDDRARRLGRSELRARVHADLAARLLSHCTYVQSAIGDEGADAGNWRPGNASLRTRAEMSDVVDVLGREYVSLMAAIERERRTIDALPRGGGRREGIDAAARDVIETYAPFIASFGEARQAQRLRALASDSAKRV